MNFAERKRGCPTRSKMSALGGKAVRTAGSEWEKRAQARRKLRIVRKSKKCTTGKTHVMNDE